MTATAGYLKSDNRFTSDTWLTSGQNLLEQAGIRGIPTAGREDFLGPPNVNLTGYQAGFSSPAFGVPGRLWSDVWNAKVSVTSVRGTHSLSAGYEYNDRSVYARHGSHSPRGSFDFNGQYTGDGFADFLLGLTSGTRRNYPLETFGLESSPYTGAFIQDFWKVRSDLTISLGLRFERWSEKKLVNGNGATFDPAIGKVIAAVDENGQVNLNGQPIAPFLAAATQGLWVPATEVGIPNSLYEADNRFGPRIGATWRPAGIEDFVVRGGYGTYYSGFTGNRSASSIVGLAVLDLGGPVLQQSAAAALGDGVAGESPELHPAVGRRGAGLEHRRGDDARVQRVGAEGAAVAVGADGVVRRHAREGSGVAESL